MSPKYSELPPTSCTGAAHMTVRVMSLQSFFHGPVDQTKSNYPNTAFSGLIEIYSYIVKDFTAYI